VDQTRLDEFLIVIVADLGAASSAVLVRIGDRLGLYKAFAGAGPLTSAELAEKTGTAERYIREWLNNQAAGGYVAYDPETRRYALPEEQALVLADETSPVLMLGGFDMVGSMFADERKLLDAFRTGDGVGWHEHHETLYPACERFFRPLYVGSLVESWIPASDGLEDPYGEIIAGPLVGAEGILYAEVDVNVAHRSRRQFDPVGHYARPDVFHLDVDTRPKVPVRLAAPEPHGMRRPAPDSPV